METVSPETMPFIMDFIAHALFGFVPGLIAGAYIAVRMYSEMERETEEEMRREEERLRNEETGRGGGEGR